MSLILSHIVKSYGKKIVLNGINLTARRGEVTALIGKNGAGKTTTFKSICGLITVEEGLIKWDDSPIEINAKNWKSRIGYLAEHNSLYPNMYVSELLTYACKLYKYSNSKVAIESICEQVGLHDYKGYKIKNLSKGYKQRVGIAQAIIHNPELLILDEPTSGLDPLQLIEIRSLIKQLAKSRVVILSSHILSEIEQICDSVYILNNGKAILHNSAADVEIEMTFDHNYDPKWFSKIGKVKQKSPYQMLITLNHLDQRAKVFDIVVANNIKILEMKQIASSLENQFLSISDQEI
ncbi:MAG: ABC transporter ATP-binding protein [Saprospiraceae bacterium]